MRHYIAAGDDPGKRTRQRKTKLSVGEAVPTMDDAPTNNQSGSKRNHSPSEKKPETPEEEARTEEAQTPPEPEEYFADFNDRCRNWEEAHKAMAEGNIVCVFSKPNNELMVLGPMNFYLYEPGRMFFVRKDSVTPEMADFLNRLFPR